MKWNLGISKVRNIGILLGFVAASKLSSLVIFLFWNSWLCFLYISELLCHFPCSKNLHPMEFDKVIFYNPTCYFVIAYKIFACAITVNQWFCLKMYKLQDLVWLPGWLQQHQAEPFDEHIKETQTPSELAFKVGRFLFCLCICCLPFGIKESFV